MKQGKKPTRYQKQSIAYYKLNPNNWLVYKKEPEQLHIVHRETGTTRKIIHI